ncbi:MAG: hypothetical protein MJ072_03645, partial [Clostridia bacterium]|nr:hypothetical protein [Clostridia bacterium]
MAMRSKKKKSTSQRIVFTIAFILFMIYVVYVVSFFVFAFFCAVKPNQSAYTQDMIRHRLFSWPKEPNFGNFLRAFDSLEQAIPGTSFAIMTWNSVWRTTTYAFLSIAGSTMVCYILAFYRNKFTRFLYVLGLFTSILPLYGSSGASFRLMWNLGLVNNPVNMFLAVTLFGGYFFYMYAFMKSLSWEYAEAAFI